MLTAAMNHSYTTKVWKEEILVDGDLPRACETPHSERPNGSGTGDMPEAWANANLVLLLRDMLLNERGGKLHLLAGLEESWVPESKSVVVENAPVTTGGTLSLRVEHVDAMHWRINVDPRGQSRAFVVHLPVEDLARVSAVRVDGTLEATAAEIQIKAEGKPSVVEVEVR